jgi:hypothetical protein
VVKNPPSVKKGMADVAKRATPLRHRQQKNTMADADFVALGVSFLGGGLAGAALNQAIYVLSTAACRFRKPHP